MAHDPIRDIVAKVARAYKVDPEQLTNSPSRSSAKIAWARQVAMYFSVRTAFEPNLAYVGRRFSRDRKTVSYAVDKVRNHIIQYSPLILAKLEKDIRDGQTTLRPAASV